MRSSTASSNAAMPNRTSSPRVRHRFPALQVRVTPGVEAHTHEFIETGTEDSKFGFGLDNGDALAAVTRVVGNRCARVRRDPLPHRIAGVPSRLVRTRTRQDGRPRAADRSDDAGDGRGGQPRRRTRRPLSLGRRATDDRAVLRDRAGRVRQGARRIRCPLAARADDRARPVDRGARRRDACTGSARSRTFPACARTSRSTAA